MPFKVRRRLLLTAVIELLSTTTHEKRRVVTHTGDDHKRNDKQDNEIQKRVFDDERLLRDDETRGLSGDAALLAFGSDFRRAAVRGVPQVAAADAGAHAAVQGAAGLAVYGLHPREAVAARGIW